MTKEGEGGPDGTEMDGEMEAWEVSTQPGTGLRLFCRDGLGPGTRLGLAVSGGADSVALLRMAAALAGAEGWRLLVLHVNHGLRGAASDEDEAFVRELAGGLGVPVDVLRLDELRAGQAGLEEAARLARYGWFRAKLGGGELDAVATGHTLDDQAETVLAKLLRGAWTRGLAGIYPAVAAAQLPGGEQGGGQEAGRVVRPLLGARRAELRGWLEGLTQGWREDESNADPAFSRNRIRHELLPVLGGFNPLLPEQLGRMATLAREDEGYWEGEVRRVLPGLLLPGRAVRGGGRASSTLGGGRSLAIEVERLREMPPALRRRVLRATAEQLGVKLDFAQTERVRLLLDGGVGTTARRVELTSELRAERTPRELRFVWEAPGKAGLEGEVVVPVPGKATGFGVRIWVEHARGEEKAREGGAAGQPQTSATLRAARPGDRVRLRHTGGAPKRVKEVLERMGVPAGERAGWPVLVWQGEIVWMRGAVLEAGPFGRELAVRAEVDPAGGE